MDTKKLGIGPRGEKRWPINLIKASRDSEDTMLNVLSDINAWLRFSLPHYRSSWKLKMKGQGAREYLRATYILLEEFFADCEAEGIRIPRSTRTDRPSAVEKLVEGL